MGKDDMAKADMETNEHQTDVANGALAFQISLAAAGSPNAAHCTALSNSEAVSRSVLNDDV